MNSKLKKIIAREGLILVALETTAAIAFFSGVYLNNTQVMIIGWIAAFILYPFYWLVRFICWAVKTLAEK